MKKLVTLMIGLGLVLGTTAAVFARPGDPQDTSKKKSKKKKQETTKSGNSVHSN
jgi:hypothetical protein